MMHTQLERAYNHACPLMESALTDNSQLSVLNEATFERVCEFVVDFCKVRRDMLTPESNLSGALWEKGSLGIQGDDAHEFMEKFFREFEIDPGEYNWRLYFYPEGSDVFGFLKLLMFWKKREVVDIRVLTLRHLHDAAIRKRWVNV